jgi:hypothetical protein
MFVVGLLLIIFGALAILAALFSSSETAVFLGRDLSAMTIFFIGLAAGIAILWGYTISKYGVKRGIRQRRETKRLQELSDKMERADEERHKHPDAEADSNN